MLTWLRNIKIRTRLSIGFMVMIVFIGCIGYVQYLRVNAISQSLDDIYAVRLPSIDLIIEADRDLFQLLTAERTLMLTDRNSEAFARLLQLHQENLRQSSERWQSFKELALGAEEQAIIPQYEYARQEWEKFAEDVLTAIQTGERQEALQLSLGQANVTFEAMREHLNRLTDINLALAERASQHAAEIYHTSAIALAATTGAGIVIVFAIVFFTTRSIIAPVKQILQAAKAFADGNFEQDLPIQRHDEIGELALTFQRTQVRVNSIMQELQRLFQEIQDGRLDQRGDMTHVEGRWRELVAGINNLIDAFARPFQETADNLSHIAKGEVPERITDEFQGDFVEVGQNLNACADVVERFVTEIEMLREAIVQGKLDIRNDLTGFRGVYANIMESINDIIATFVGHIDQLPVPVFIIDTDYTVQFVNKEVSTVFSSSRERLIGQKCYDFFKNADCRTERCACAQAMRSGTMVRSETEASVDGQEFQFSYSGVPVKDTAGNIIGALEIAQDHSEMKQAMNEIEQQSWLRSGQAELSDIMRGEQDMVTLSKNIITYLSKHLGVQLGALYLASGDHEERTFRLSGSYAYLARKGNRNSFKLGEGLVGQAAVEQECILYSHVPDDYVSISSGLGETVPHYIFIAPFVYEGETTGVIELGTVREFSHVQMDFVNQALENIAVAFNSVQSRRKMKELLDATQQQAKELQQQQEELRQSNEELENHTQALLQSEQKLQQQQEELRQSNEELEHQARTLELQKSEMQEKNDALEEAQRLIEEKARDLELSSRYKSEFLANMSHELRTPLNSLLILSNLLKENKEGNLNEKQVEFAQMINKSGTELLGLINEVLDLSKVEAGKMELNLEEMSLHGLASYIKQHFTHVAEEKGLSLTINLSQELPETASTDRQRVEQIIKNFLSNAFKFTKEGGISVNIARPEEGVKFSHSALIPHNTIGISVSDSGVGIPEDKQRLIFEAFQQADGSTSRKYGGTGLGLSISREFARLLGGEVQLRSKVGKGSTFTLYIPERYASETTGEPESTSAAAASDASSEKGFTSAEPLTYQHDSVEQIRDDRLDCIPGHKTILIIEDDPDFAKILFELAREHGFNGLIAGDGAAGLQLAYQYLPCAITLDLGLPGIDGQTVLEKLHTNPETQHIPVHIISAQDRSLNLEEFHGGDFLMKPVSTEDLNALFTGLEQKIPGRVKRVLIIEDDSVARKSQAELLKSDTVDIVTASSGQEALQLLQETSVDCLVVDLGLEDMSGLELLAQIKQHRDLAELPVVVYTGRDVTKDEQMQLDEYAESTIIKGAKSQERLLDEVTLFLKRIESNLPEEQRRKPRIYHDKDTILHGKTILVVDDDLRNVYALANVLDDKGLNVLVAENGESALQQLDENAAEIDLVLMDIMMPEMDGYEAMQRIRKQMRFNKLPIIALTAKAMKGDRQKCLEAGANDYLSKPLDLDKLFSLLRVWLY